MRRPDPHKRAYQIEDALDNAKTPTDPKAQAVVDAVNGDVPNEVLKYAWSKYDELMERTIIEAYLLADTPYQQIAEATGVPAPVLKAYTDYIFDVTVFRDRLERISYVARCRNIMPREQQAYLETALTRGPEYITWLLNRKNTLLPRAVLEAAMTEGVYMGMAHRGTDPASEQAKQSRQWLSSGVQAASILMRLDPKSDEDALSDLRLALIKDMDSVVSAATTGAPAAEDIVH